MPDSQLITNPADITLKREDDVQQIFGRPPRHFLRWGITVLFFFFLTLVGMAFFIEYPDTVVAPVQITTENPPVAVVARVSGKIQTLAVENEEMVEAGQPLAELENTANRNDILLLEQAIEIAMQEENPYEFKEIDFDPNLQLGTLQTSYASFLQDREDLKFYLKNRHAGRQRSSLRKQIAQLDKLNESLSDQELTLKNIKNVAAEKLNRAKQLRASNDYNAEQLESAQTEFLVAENNWKQLRNQLINNDLKISQINTQILNLRQDDSVVSNEKWQTIKTDLQQLQREIKEWKQSYLLTAPKAGQVSLPNTMSAQQFIKAGEELLTIVPQGDAGKIIAEAQLPLANSGKVEEFDAVNIRLNGFPYQEFGVIRGAVREIAAVPNEAGTAYLVEIELPNGLATTYEETLDFRQRMQGEAHIITKKRQIAARIFDPILSAFYNRP